MIVTFLIGNGFDRNLGLDTTYSDFVKEYNKIDAPIAILREFHRYIDENEELWSAAEVAMGDYTKQFEDGAAEAFSACHTDFCENLAIYLKNQMARINYNESKDAILKAFANLNQLYSNFPTQEREIINRVFHERSSENITFNFLCFNYTYTLDKCVSIVKNTPHALGSHKYSGQNRDHVIGTICHVHGTVDKDMVFGVNDESQISKPEIFECEDGDLYKNMLIKVQANASFLENTDETAAQMIHQSHIIYIYGMSIGETDKLWWDRICNWLYTDPTHRLIVQKYNMPIKSVVPVNYQRAERNVRREITRHSTLDEERKIIIQNRIHVTNENIFQEISNIAKDENAKEYLYVLEQLKAEESQSTSA